MTYLRVKRHNVDQWKIEKVDDARVSGTWYPSSWDEMKVVIEENSLDLLPRTVVVAPPEYIHSFKRTPAFDPKEVTVQEFWMWQGNIHNHQPSGGGLRNKPRRIQPVRANLMHSDHTGRLWYFDFTWRGHYGINTSRVAMVNVWNATPEPSGEYQMFSIRVPRSARTAQEAVAWTFRVRGDQYHPLKET